MLDFQNENGKTKQIYTNTIVLQREIERGRENKKKSFEEKGLQTMLIEM